MEWSYNSSIKNNSGYLKVKKKINSKLITIPFWAILVLLELITKRESGHVTNLVLFDMFCFFVFFFNYFFFGSFF